MDHPLLLGSGPSPVPQRVLDALAEPTLGHLDPVFGEVMDDVARLLRATFVTDNAVTFPLSATGSGGMQTMVDALIAPGERVVVGVCGAFGARMADALGRAGAEVVTVEGEWGRPLEVERLIAAAREPCAALFVVHGETSTGIVQDLDGLADAVHAHDGLFLLDCVTSLGGVPLSIDDAGVDAAFSGTQKCLNVPPGLAPFTLDERAHGRLQRRSWYFDLQAYSDYWLTKEGGRPYHHTAPTNMVVALREGLRIVHEEPREERFARHLRGHLALRAAFGVLGFEPLVPEEQALSSLLSLVVPDHVDEAAVRGAMLREDRIEVSGGLGPLAGRVWRVGVMGEGARPEPQERLVRAVARRTDGDEAAAVRALEDAWRT
jgi:alanine-glyoxylate transaminase / serine-glyoxylate transaminase / serine-pyruvate transaminase